MIRKVPNPTEYKPILKDKLRFAFAMSFITEWKTFLFFGGNSKEGPMGVFEKESNRNEKKTVSVCCNDLFITYAVRMRTKNK